MSNICWKCFGEYDEGSVCPHCGYDAAAQEGKYPLALQPGSVLGGRYIVGRVLGEGGFGITYAAQDYDTKQLVAIKEYFPSALVTRRGSKTMLVAKSAFAEFNEGRQKFLEEAKTLSRFNGLDNICDIYSYFEENGSAYFAMEYVEGRSLKDYIMQRGRGLDCDEALKLLLPVMRALSRVHAEGIIHRDIAPDNILVSPEGKATLIDFGAARYSMGEISQSLDVILKHGFAPMEQYARHGRQGPWTDVYAMAASIYYTVSGKVLPDSVERAQADTAKPLAEIADNVPENFSRALENALEIQPQKRCRSMEEFIALLQAPAAKAAGGKKSPLPLIAALGAAAVIAAVLLMMPGKDKAAAPENDAPASPAPTVETQTETPAPEEPAVNWELSQDGTMYIYAGDEQQVLPEKLSWDSAELKAKVTKLVIGEGITHIGADSFEGWSALREIQLPRSLVRVGEGAFAGCDGIESLCFGGSSEEWNAVQIAAGNEALSSAEKIMMIIAAGYDAENILWEFYLDGTLRFRGSGAMYNYSAGEMTPWRDAGLIPMIKCIEFGEGITEIATFSFKGCPQLERVVFPESLRGIGRGAFTDNSKLDNLILPAGLENLEICFQDCRGISSVVIPDAVQHLQDGTFANNKSLRSVKLPAGLKTLSGFSGCSALEEITVPEGTSHIERSAFAGCTSLRRVELPASLVSIDESAFVGCSALEEVRYQGSAEDWADIGGSDSINSNIVIFSE